MRKLIKDSSKHLQQKFMQQRLTVFNSKPVFQIAPYQMFHSYSKPLEQLLSLNNLFQLEILMHFKEWER